MAWQRGHFKAKMKMLNKESNYEDLHTKLSRYLLTYWMLTKTGKSSAELLFNRQPRTKFDVLHCSEVKQQVAVFESNMDSEAELAPGDAVFALNFGRCGGRWLPGYILCGGSYLETSQEPTETARHSYRCTTNLRESVD